MRGKEGIENDSKVEEEEHEGDKEKDERNDRRTQREPSQQTSKYIDPFKIIYLNARSILNKLDDLTVLVFEEKPDLILITETWCNADINNAMLSVQGYNIEPELRTDRQDTVNGIGGGLLVYVKSGIKIKPLPEYNDFIQHCRFQVLNGRNQEPLNVTLIYKSPNCSKENELKLANILKIQEKNSLVIGDFNCPNIDFINQISDRKGVDILESARSSLLVQLIDFPTHNRGNILDCALTNTADRFVNIENIGNLKNSDHAIIKLELDFIPRSNKTTEKVRDWKNGDKPGLSTYLNEVKWSDILSDKNANDAWETMKMTISEALDRYIPLKLRRDAYNPPWMTRQVKRLIAKKRRLWKKYVTDRNDQFFQNYKSAEKDAKKAIRNVKRKYEQQLATNSNLKKFNSYVKTKTKYKTTIGPLKDGNNTISDDKDMANMLNNFFVSVFTTEDVQNVPTLDNLPFTNEVNDLYISKTMINKQIKRLRPDSAPGPDNITARLLIEHTDSLTNALEIIFNKSLQTGVVPDDWKIAHVTPIYKKGSKSTPGNYRPVSLTSVPCKVMEACLKQHIVEHLDSNKLIKASQHGFVNKRSTTTNLLEFMETLTRETDLGNSMDTVYLDFAKAFDKVPRLALMNKMKAHGIRGKIHDWILGWLTNRKQCTVLNGKKSNWASVGSGVPQGSVLGPLAFIIYINDIDNEADTITILNKFADDTKLSNLIRSDNDARELQTCLDNLTGWAKKWGMEFNISKCKVMHLGKNNARYEYNMEGQKLSTTDCEKDVGVKVSNNLKTTEQCRAASVKANLVLTQISKSFHFRDRHVFLKLYKQYVRPHMEFGVSAWSPWSAADIELLERVQRRAVSMVSGLTSETYETKLRELNLLSLEKRRHMMDMVNTYKIVRGVDNVKSDVWFNLVGDNPTRQTRQTNCRYNIHRSEFRGEVRRNFFSIRVIDNWNKLPDELKLSNNVNTFKTKIKQMMLSGEV